MPASRSDLADLLYFVAIARRLSFRGAAAELGVGASALSQSMRSLETRLGVRLFERTSRTVALTEAGRRLLGSIEDPLRLIDDAVDELGEDRDNAATRLRVAALDGADVLFLAPVMPAFADRCPRAIVHVCADAGRDHAGADVPDLWIGLDDGVRDGSQIVPLTGDLPRLTAAAPSYVRRAGEPTAPDELRSHRCIGFVDAGASSERWFFAGPEGEIVVSVRYRSVWSGSEAALAAAVAGEGVVHAPEPMLSGLIADGTLLPLLGGWTARRPGYRMRTSAARPMSATLRVLVDLVSEGAAATPMSTGE